MSDPWFKVFARDDVLANARILMLDNAQVGGLLFLMAHAWIDPSQSLPADDVILAKLARMSPKQWKAHGADIRAFGVEENGRIYFQSLKAQAEHNAAVREIRAKGGHSRAARMRQPTVYAPASPETCSSTAQAPAGACSSTAQADAESCSTGGISEHRAQSTDNPPPAPAVRDVAEPGETPYAEWPTELEWMAFCERLGLPEWKASEAFLKREAKKWAGVRDWKAEARLVLHWWMRDGRQVEPLAAKNGVMRGGGGRPERGSTAWRMGLQEERAAIMRQIEQHVANEASAYSKAEPTAEERADLRARRGTR
jgi:uncharacterized protein YdaU (DUF1376 family)